MANEFNIKNGFISNSDSIIIGGLTASTISATTYYNLPTDIRVTGGTYSNSTGIATFRNNTGGTFNVTGFTTGFTASNYVSQGRLNADQSITPNGDVILQFIDDFDPQNWWDATSYRLTPNIAGYYIVDFGVWWPSFTATTGQCNIQARKNGDTFMILQTPLHTTNGNSVTGTKVVYMNGSSDYIDFTAYHNNGVSVSLQYGSANGQGTWFSAALLAGGSTVSSGGGSSSFTGGTITGPTNFTAGMTANTISTPSISATTYLNLPTDIRVTGGTYSSGTATFTNNTGGTFSVTGFSTSTATAFTGGTVTGATNFTGGLTANTISATTYLNLPIDVRVTGGTYSNGTTTFTNNTGGTFTVTGFKTNDLVVTGGTYSNGVTTFTNNTGGTFNVTTTTNYSAGVISGATYSSTGSGQINLPAIKVALYNNANNIEPITVYDVASGTTGTGGIPALVDQDTNYIVVEYNGGTPRYYVYDNDGLINDSSVVLFMIVYRASNFVHTLEFGNQGAGLANKLNDRFIMTDRFGWESGLSLFLSGSTGVVCATSGVAWNGPNRQSLTAVDSSGSTYFKNYHTGGTWAYTTTGKTMNNTYYDNGTNIVAATAGKYLINWYFRGQEVDSHLYEVYGTNEYDNVSLAQLTTEPSLPELITSHAILLGRIIVQVGASTGLTESAFNTVFKSTQVTSHNDLINLQGGAAGQYYHLTSNQYNNLALTNTNNNFSTLQSFNNGLSATTISGGTIYGDGSNITNIIPYGIINAMSSGIFLT